MFSVKHTFNLFIIISVFSVKQFVKQFCFSAGFIALSGFAALKGINSAILGESTICYVLKISPT
jgi:hypothetical protein